MNVSVKDSSIQPIAAKAAPQIKRASAAQYPTDKRQIEVYPRGNVRQLQALSVENIAQQQVIEMAAVAGDVDDFAISGDGVQLVGMVEFDAVINSMPEPT